MKKPTRDYVQRCLACLKSGDPTSHLADGSMTLPEQERLCEAYLAALDVVKAARDHIKYHMPKELAKALRKFDEGE